MVVRIDRHLRSGRHKLALGSQQYKDLYERAKTELRIQVPVRWAETPEPQQVVAQDEDEEEAVEQEDRNEERERQVEEEGREEEAEESDEDGDDDDDNDDDENGNNDDGDDDDEGDHDDDDGCDDDDDEDDDESPRKKRAVWPSTLRHRIGQKLQGCQYNLSWARQLLRNNEALFTEVKEVTGEESLEKNAVKVYYLVRPFATK